MGASWNDIPAKYKPHWSTWKIEGTPFEETQKRLHAKGLHDPWLRNEVWIYKIPKKAGQFSTIISRGMLPGFILFLGLLTVKKVFSKSDDSSSHH